MDMETSGKLFRSGENKGKGIISWKIELSIKDHMELARERFEQEMKDFLLERVWQFIDMKEFVIEHICRDVETIKNEQFLTKNAIFAITLPQNKLFLSSVLTSLFG